VVVPREKRNNMLLPNGSDV